MKRLTALGIFCGLVLLCYGSASAGVWDAIDELSRPTPAFHMSGLTFQRSIFVHVLKGVSALTLPGNFRHIDRLFVDFKYSF